MSAQTGENQFSQGQPINNRSWISASSNAYVRSAWAELAIANRYDPALPGIEEYVQRVGRGLLIYPIYRGLVAQGDWGRHRAAALFTKAKAAYHPSTAAAVEKIVLGS